jgi:hypothetical protein
MRAVTPDYRPTPQEPAGSGDGRPTRLTAAFPRRVAQNSQPMFIRTPVRFGVSPESVSIHMLL